MAQDTPLDPELTEWIARQRWFSGKGGTPDLHEIGRWSVGTGEAGVEADVLLVEDRTGGTLYQVPVVTRTAPVADRSPSTAGTATTDRTTPPSCAGCSSWSPRAARREATAHARPASRPCPASAAIDPPAC
ncbi:maltokinase N-terminal cap-like domain-containing protein [Naasia aerilata]|uniref:Maltokinase N-terminal cap domain-containing protein n=1 Tax=Naasia aerilata TaxID=1162966 RepID=A0ABN6XRP8_9MICO|nr:hypothetical protein [Naasia aerilata]BDZ47666.1 hypothetical protein GCM10025866_35750 [Naasia aerilata]